MGSFRYTRFVDAPARALGHPAIGVLICYVIADNFEFFWPANSNFLDISSKVPLPTSDLSEWYRRTFALSIPTKSLTFPRIGLGFVGQNHHMIATDARHATDRKMVVANWHPGIGLGILC